MSAIRPKPGFNPMLIKWGGPDEPRTETCSYCEAPLPEDDVPLILWNDDGWCAEFCRGCQEKWWGLKSFDFDPEENRD
jgi:hypothetical protein